jgi:hypothetical protein
VVFHVPNGGYRTRTEAAILQGLGVLPGVADLLILWKPARLAFIEMKAPGQRKDVNTNQVAFGCRMSELGIPYAVCDSLDMVKEKISEWEVPSREHKF